MWRVGIWVDGEGIFIAQVAREDGEGSHFRGFDGRKMHLHEKVAVPRYILLSHDRFLPFTTVLLLWTSRTPSTADTISLLLPCIYP